MIEEGNLENIRKTEVETLQKEVKEFYIKVVEKLEERTYPLFTILGKLFKFYGEERNYETVIDGGRVTISPSIHEIYYKNTFINFDENLEANANGLPIEVLLRVINVGLELLEKYNQILDNLKDEIINTEKQIQKSKERFKRIKEKDCWEFQLKK